MAGPASPSGTGATRPIVVIGAGAIGTALALGLARAGHRVILVARGARLAWLQANPAELVREDGVLRTPLEVVGPDAAWTSDCVFLCTKAQDLPGALAVVAPRLAPGGRVVTLQNGVEAPLQAASALPGAAILAGRVHGFFEMDGPRARHVGVPPSVVMGGLAGASPADERRVRALFDAAGFASTVSPDMGRDLWEKMTLFASLSLVGLALELPAGRICERTADEGLLRAAMREVVAVARARGTALEGTVVDDLIAFVRRFPAEATTSLQRDHAAGLASEYDAVVGSLLRLAAAAGTRVPTFTRLDAAIAAGTGRGA